MKLITKILEHGRGFLPSKPPLELPRGKVGDCFDTCFKAVYEHTKKNNNIQKYKYVEGVALNPITNEWIVHAWVTDMQERYAFDLTWQAIDVKGEEQAIPTAYVGLVLDLDLMTEFILTTEYKSVLNNGWRNQKVADKLLPFKLEKPLKFINFITKNL